MDKDVNVKFLLKLNNVVDFLLDSLDVLFLCNPIESN